MADEDGSHNVAAAHTEEDEEDAFLQSVFQTGMVRSGRRDLGGDGEWEDDDDDEDPDFRDEPEEDDEDDDFLGNMVSVRDAIRTDSDFPADADDGGIEFQVVIQSDEDEDEDEDGEGDDNENEDEDDDAGAERILGLLRGEKLKSTTYTTDCDNPNSWRKNGINHKRPAPRLDAKPEFEQCLIPR